jgi:hypothetical protein
MLQMGIAAMAFVSLHPYFLWSHQKPAYAVATLVVMASAALGWRALDFSPERVVLAAGFALFFLYLSLLPKVQGGATRWFFLIPFAVVLIHLRQEHLRRAFGWFQWLFALSLLPGMVLWLLALAGVPLELRYTDPPPDIRQRGDTGYLELPGAVFILTNSLVLPHGGVLFRLCGMYDEPGTVGTIAALCLAVTRFRVTDFRGAVCLAAGAMSLSVAFAILVGLGAIATAAAAKRPRLLAATLVCALAGALPLSGLRSSDPSGSNITVFMSGRFAPSTPDGVRQHFAPAPEWGLRNTPGLDSRTQPGMRPLLDKWAGSGAATLLFGVAADASIVHAPGSSVWYRVLTDFGIVGFVGAFLLFAWPSIVLWRSGRLDAGVVIFCALFLMSFYQRPIIWLPAQMLIYLAGTYGLSNPREKHV